MVLSDFSVLPDEAIYVGDSLNDASCAKASGLYFIVVLESGLRRCEDFKSLDVDYFA
jgi:phosphoglycolate phosphatase-like HAD superfamily hydrolase